MLVVSCRPATHNGQKRSERSATAMNAASTARSTSQGAALDMRVHVG